MSAAFRLTARAYDDLQAIARYTLKSWGRQHRDRYLREIDARFQWLADNPRHGRPRYDIAPGYHSFHHREHIVFYLMRDGSDNGGIDIIGIPHRAMDIHAYFS